MFSLITSKCDIAQPFFKWTLNFDPASDQIFQYLTRMLGIPLRTHDTPSRDTVLSDRWQGLSQQRKHHEYFENLEIWTMNNK